jgi:UDP-apiose/xylose synthase
MRIAILGAGGFIGSHLVEHLIRQDEHSVIGIDVTDEKLEGINSEDFTFHAGDIRTSPGLLNEVVRDADMVVDLVAYANPSMYVTSPLEVFDLNFMQNLKVAELCIRHHKRLIQYSSAEIYGKAQEGERYSESGTDLVLGPIQKQRWMYATGKILLERVLYAHGIEGNLEYTIVRPFNFIGSRIDYLVPPGSMGGPRVFPHFMSALLTGGPLYLVDGGDVHRAFMHIEDANSAFQAVLDHPRESRNEIFNFGNPANDLTIREVAELMCDLYQELTGKKPKSKLVAVSGQEFYGEGYEDSNRLPPDITKISRLGWRPLHDVRTTFSEAMAYYLERRNQGLNRFHPNRPRLELAGGH